MLYHKKLTQIENKKALAPLIVGAILLGVFTFFIGGLTFFINVGLLKVVGALVIIMAVYGLIKNTIEWTAALILIGVGLVLVFNLYDLTNLFGNWKTLTIGDVISNFKPS